VSDKDHDYVVDLQAAARSHASHAAPRPASKPAAAAPAAKPAPTPKPAGKLRDLKDPFAN
jgi:hypothetical protein